MKPGLLDDLNMLALMQQQLPFSELTFWDPPMVVSDILRGAIEKRENIWDLSIVTEACKIFMTSLMSFFCH